MAGIAADPRGDGASRCPDVVERRAEQAGGAVAQVVEAAAAVQCAIGRLEADAAAIAGRPDRRTHHLAAEGERHEARADRRGRSGARTAGRALRIVRVGRAREHFGGREFGRRGLADDDRASLAQRLHAGRIAPRLRAGPHRRALGGRQVRRFDDVLDADRDAVERRQRLAVEPALRRALRLGARAFEGQRDERANLVLAGVEAREPGFQQRERARRAAPERGGMADVGRGRRIGDQRALHRRKSFGRRLRMDRRDGGRGTGSADGAALHGYTMTIDEPTSLTGLEMPACAAGGSCRDKTARRHGVISGHRDPDRMPERRRSFRRIPPADSIAFFGGPAHRAAPCVTIVLFQTGRRIRCPENGMSLVTGRLPHHINNENHHAS